MLGWVLRSRTSTTSSWSRYICKSCDFSCESRNFFIPLRSENIPQARFSTHTHMKKRVEKKIKVYRDPEKVANQRRHQFGQPEANPSGNPSAAVNQREFYRWAETIATEEELRKYSADKSHPYARRKFVDLLLSPAEDMEDMFALTNQTHGAPKQRIEVQSLPKVSIEFFRKKHE